MKRAVILTVLLACAITLFAAGEQGTAAKPQFVLKFALVAGEGPKDNDAETAWAYATKEYIEKESNGRIKVDLYFGSQLGSQTEMVQGSSSGSIEYGIINVATLQNFNKKTMVLSIPGLFESADEVDKILDSTWMASFYKEFTSGKGIIVAHQFTNGFRNFTNSKKLLMKPTDAKGLVFRVMDSPVSMKMVEALGASPVPIPSADMYVALQNRVVDGQENPLAAIVQNRLYEVQKYLILDGHMASMVAGIISKKFYDTLPPDLQMVVMEGSKAGRNKAREVIKTFNAGAIGFLKEKGMQIYDPTVAERKAWFEGPPWNTLRLRLAQMSSMP
jgi:tripartite ATP-independent transporter DctP family solute receptor